MDFKTIKHAVLGSAALATLTGLAAATPTWQETLNETLDIVTSLLPKFGDLLNGVGTNLIWPVVYILIILGIAAVILGLFGMITGVVLAVVGAVSRFSGGLGRTHGKRY
jgi:hypothetical protein